MNYDYEYNGTNENIPSFQERNNFTTNNMNIEPPRKRRKWPIVLLILLLLIVGVLIYLTFFTDKLDFIKPDDNYSEFDPNKGKIESNSNIVSNSNKTSNSNKKSNSNSNIISNVNKDVTSVAITPNTPSVVVGSTVTLKTNITPNDAKDKSITWKSSDTKIATVNNKGVVTGVKVGTTTITATSKNGKKASVKVTVTKKSIPVTGISVSNSSVTLKIGGGYGNSPTITPNNATNQEVVWTSSNTSVATVNEYGYVKALAVGTTTITVTTKDGGHKATIKVTVTNPDVSYININSSTTTLYVGKTLTPTISYYPTNATGKSVTWSSSDTNIATVSSRGVITGKSEGNVLIKAITPNGKYTIKKFYVRLNPDDYKLEFEILKNSGTYSYVQHGVTTFFDYQSITYNGQTFSPAEEGNVLNPFTDVDESITTATMITKGGNKLTIKVEYKHSNL